MTRPDELDLYRQVLARHSPDNPRKEADIAASLRAFDNAFPPARGLAWRSWLNVPLLLSGTAAMAAGFVVFAWLPQSGSEPTELTIAPPELRLALPDDAGRNYRPEAEILAAFSEGLPQYFPIPWERGRLIALLEGEEPRAEEDVLFAAHGRRLSLTPKTVGMMSLRGQDEAYQSFVIALTGLALLQRGEALGPSRTKEALIAQALGASQGLPLREAAIAIVLGK